ncbi:hypothetical protein M3D57_00600 [Corynebacterium sanguinis]|nr:DUF6764 family protein [Corynebacterium sanguinis]MCT1412355.1 hypothetical protein [Corynebacterium sanguinis]MCT1584208.1 hypothetical protein [Corynebacterium sanguinis]MCT2046015.1 hypothetical protein [Corynebacterium sanguinis]MCT2159081.1 hypothetical protein [Corynebacterium sanguinis]TVS28354.1 hypothetical protein EKI56_00865 [Corynebacterium sanguinis]
MNITSFARRASISLAVAAGAAALGIGTAAAAPAPSPIPQPTLGNVQFAGALPEQIATNGNAAATAANAIALGVSVDGGRAVANATNFSGPAAIAVGPASHAEAWGVNPGLAIAVAGPNSTVRVSGTEPTQCSGEWGLAGDFQTLTGCVVYMTPNGAVNVPLDSRPLLSSSR